MKQPSRKTLTNKADRLFSERVRERGYCEVAEWFPAIACNGGLQCCHIISRRYKAIRWNTSNAVAGCAAHHLYGTHHPLEWGVAVERAGINFTELRHRALNDPPMDPADVIASLA